MGEFLTYYVDIIINIALLLGLGSIYIILPFKEEKNTVKLLIVTGLFAGGIGLILMNAQFNITEGILLDTRSVLLSLTAAFFGPIPGIIAALITSAYRIYQGGSGAITGVVVIILTMLSGLLFRKYRLSKISLGNIRVYLELYLFGVGTHIVMILCFFLLGIETAMFVLKIIFWPVMITFPLVTVPVGVILLVQRRNNQMTEAIEFVSTHDYLTGLFNRHYLEEATKKLDDPSFYPLSIIMGDVNGLKLVNDSFGHLLGDELLKQIASILKINIKDDHVLARWGGDEFIILMPNTTLLEANEIVINITKMCRESKLADFTPSISLGCSVKLDQETTMDQLFTAVEELMYRNKLSDDMSVRSSFISILENTLVERKYETEKHSKNILEYGNLLAEKLGLSASKIEELNLIARLHDIGKIGVSENILLKPGRLTDEEYEKVQKHSEIGFRILNSISELRHIAEGVLHHHEKWDGTGYPSKLAGEDIPLVSRITAICDSFEVMVKGRQYQEPMSLEDAALELKRCSGTQFDPKLVELFLEILETREI